MSDLISVVTGKATVNTRQVADHFKLKGGHRYVMSQVRSIIESSKADGDEFGVQNYLQSSYRSLQNKELECFEMTRDGFAILAMGFTGPEAMKWKKAYLKAFNEMEEMLSCVKEQSVMKKLSDAIELMEKDKSIASTFGSGLNEWKKIRSAHIDKVNKLMSDAQLLLKF